MTTQDEAPNDPTLEMVEQDSMGDDPIRPYIERILYALDEPGDVERVRKWCKTIRALQPTEGQKALNAFTEEGGQANLFRAAEAALRQADAPRLEVRQLALVKEPLPEPVIWREGEKDGAILSAGDVCILSGAGGVGKSTLALQLAISAARAELNAAHVCGLSIRTGPVLYASYEDVPAVMFHRGQRICGELEDEQSGELEDEQKRKKGIPADVHLAGMFGRPIYGPPNGSANDVPAPLDAFRELFDAARTIQARLIVIDPAAAAFSSPKASVEWVRLFLDAMRKEANEIGCGILLVAHSTKAARNARETGDPGSVAGSAGWYDAARGVIILHETTNGGEGPRLEIMKANYGLRGNPIKLERSENGVWKRPDTKFDNNDAPEEKDLYAPENAPF